MLKTLHRNVQHLQALVEKVLKESDHIPMETGQPCTWRSLLIKVAAEVIVRTRRIVVRLSSSWPHLGWYLRVCERLRNPHPIPAAPPSG